MSRSATVVCSDPEYGKRRVAGELGTDNVDWKIELDTSSGKAKIKVTGTVKENDGHS